MGNLPSDAVQKRDQIEQAMFDLAAIDRDLAEVDLRIRQAMRRSSMVSTVLDPAVGRLATVAQRIRSARASLADHWSAQAPQRWSGSDAPPEAK